jgi:hypothetical protein
VDALKRRGVDALKRRGARALACGVGRSQNAHKHIFRVRRYTALPAVRINLRLTIFYIFDPRWLGC